MFYFMLFCFALFYFVLFYLILFLLFRTLIIPNHFLISLPSQLLKGASDDLLTSSTSLSLSFTLFLSDSISANRTTNSDKCSWILFTKAASSLNLNFNSPRSSSFSSTSLLKRSIYSFRTFI